MSCRLSAWVAAAARHTLESGSARVWECRFSEPSPPPERDFTLVAEGIADLTKQRVLLRSKTEEGWGYPAKVIAERFPWLEDDGGVDGDRDEGEMVTVRVGTAAFFSVGDGWRVVGGRPGDPFAGRRAPGDPLWILEVLTLVDAVTLDSQ